MGCSSSKISTVAGDQDTAVAVSRGQGRRHPATASGAGPAALATMFRRGQQFHNEGQFRLAACAFQKLLPLQEKSLGPDHPDTVETLDLICRELAMLVEFQEALVFLQTKLQHYEEVYGSDRFASVNALRNMGDIYYLDLKSQEAIFMYGAAHRSSERGLGPEHRVTREIEAELCKLQPPPMTLGLVQCIAIKEGLSVPGEPFSNALSMSFDQILNGGFTSVTGMVSSSNPEDHFKTALGMAETLTVPSTLISPILSHSGGCRDFGDSPAPGTLESRGQNINSFSSLVTRSVAAWKAMDAARTEQAIEENSRILHGLRDLDELLSLEEVGFWFFQLGKTFRSQAVCRKWDPEHLADYMLLPMEGGFVSPSNCIFLSHYWQTPTHPDPDGEALAALQKRIHQGKWQSYCVWLDWSCMPQRQRTPSQDKYFKRTLQTIGKLIRECSFLWTFPQFEPRLWVLCEVAEYAVSRSRAFQLADMGQFMDHIAAMGSAGVRPVLNRYGYKCTNQGDLEQVLAWLDILVVLYKNVPSIRVRRQILDAVNNPTVQTCMHVEAGVEIDKAKGVIKVKEETYTFNSAPFLLSAGSKAPNRSIRIKGDYDAELARAMEKMDGLDFRDMEYMGREYDREGEHRIAEVIHRSVLDREGQPWYNPTSSTFIALDNLAANLEQQARYAEAEEFYSRLVTLHQQKYEEDCIEAREHLVAVRRKRQLQDLYSQWKTASLQSILDMPRPELPRVHHADMKAGMFIKMRQHAVELQSKGQLRQSWTLLWHVVERAKVVRGPYHMKTQQAMAQLAKVLRIDKKEKAAEALLQSALAVSDYTVGPEHPDSLALISHLAASAPNADRKEWYRLQLERSLGWMKWSDEDLFSVKHNLSQHMEKHEELRIVSTVGVMGKKRAVVRLCRAK